MKKAVIFTLIAVAVLGFAVLVFFGFRYARGVPVRVEEVKRVSLAVPFVAKELDLREGVDTAFWDGQAKQDIELVYQIMVLPWPRTERKSPVSHVRVSAFHNKKEIYFYLEWPDATEDVTVGIGKFSDAGALMFPMDPKAESSSLMMGFLHKANIWHWKASRDREYWLKERVRSEAYADFLYPFEEEELFVVSKEQVPSAVSDLLAVRVGTVTAKPTQAVQGRGIYAGGVWKTVFKRSIEAEDPETDAQFDPKANLCAFAVWDGSSGDRGGRKSISDWVELEME